MFRQVLSEDGKAHINGMVNVRNGKRGGQPNNKNAVEYYRKLYPQRTESDAEKAIRNDTNCDWIVFDDSSVLVCEYIS